METERFMKLNDQSFVFDVLGDDSVILTIRAMYEGTEAEGSLQVFISYFDGQQQLCIPDAAYEFSPQFGSWARARVGGGEPLDSTFDLVVPSDALALEVRLVSTARDRSCLVQRPQLSHKQYSDSEKNVLVGDTEKKKLESLPVDELLFIFYCNSDYSDLALWNDRVIGLADGLIEEGASVVLIGRKPSRDTVLPWFDVNIDRVMCCAPDMLTQVISVASQRLGSNNTFVCCSSPDVSAFFAIERCNSLRWNTVYDVQYDLEEIQRLGTLRSYHTYVEYTIAKKVAYVTVSGSSLAQKLIFSGVSPYKFNVVPNAISKQILDRIKSTRFSSHKRQRLNAKYTVGFVGDLSALTVDWPELISLARLNSNIRIELVGKGQPNIENLPDNIKIVVASHIDDLVAICADWSAALVVCAKSRISESTVDLSIRLNVALGLEIIVPSKLLPLNVPGLAVYKSCKDLLDILNDLKKGNRSKYPTGEIAKSTVDWFERAAQFKEAIMHG